MVQVVFNELLNILFHAAIIFTGDADQLPLQFGVEIHFHETSLSAQQTSVKRPQWDGSRHRIVRGHRSEVGHEDTVSGWVDDERVSTEVRRGVFQNAGRGSGILLNYGYGVDDLFV